jgi:hypothetical protein
MLILGLILLIIGWVVGISLLVWIGVVLLLVGAVLLLTRPGGRYYW